MRREHQNYAEGEEVIKTISLVDVLQFLQRKDHATDSCGGAYIDALEQHVRDKNIAPCPVTGLNLIEEIFVTASRTSNAGSAFCQRALEILAPFDIALPPTHHRITEKAESARAMPPALVL